MLRTHVSIVFSHVVIYGFAWAAWGSLSKLSTIFIDTDLPEQDKTRGATVTGCAPVISFYCKGLFISMKTKSNVGGKIVRDMGK